MSSRMDSTPAGTLIPSIGGAISGATASTGTLETDSTGALTQNTLGTLKYVCLGKLIGANFNSTADQAIPISASNYLIKDVIVTNASTSLTTAVGGVYSAASKGGSTLVAATQVYSALSAASKYVGLTLAALVGTDRRTETTLYLSLTVAQGAAATADVYVFGLKLA